MPCLCGDICCPSCGPAQGNTRCELCRVWATDGCEHVSRRTGQYKKQYRKQIEALHQYENDLEDQWSREIREIDQEGGL